MKKFILCTFMCILHSIHTFAQPINSEIKDVSMPSPNASSLGIYTDIPVDYSTGVPGVSIPIGTVTSGSLQTNVNLSYHAGGIRVGELAGWAGTNWSIQYGGHISRTVQGLKDEATYGYLNMASSIVVNNGCLQTLYGTTGQELAAANSQIDLEPDIFSYSAGGASGKFYFDGNGNVVTVPKSDVKITYTLWQNTLHAKRIKSFKITLTDGTTYDYGINDAGTVDAIELSLYSEGSWWSASGWHLIKITSADQKYSISFNYTQEEYKYYSRAGSATIPGGININGYSTNKTNMTAYRLASIVPSDGTEGISFTATDVREDLEHTATKESKRLNKITVGSSTNTACKEFNFYYTYWADNSVMKSNSVADKRLFLDEVEERSCDNTIINPRYKFEYVKDNNTTQYINRLSSAVDHWGYYNGAHGNMKGFNMPYTSLTTTWNNTVYTDAKGTSNRETSETYMKIGSLNKITFPTGGSKTLDMEANEVFSTEPVNIPVPLATLANAQCTWAYTTPVATYTTPVNGYQFLGDIMYTWENYGSTGQNCCSNPWTKIVVKDQANNFLAEALVYPNCTSTQSNPGIQSGLLTDLFPSLQVNTQYKFELYLFFAGAKFQILDQQLVGINYGKKAGGLRAKKVILNDGISASNDVVKSYKYTESSGLTSSKLVRKPIYSHLYKYKITQNCGNIPSQDTGYQFAFFFFEYCITPLSSFEGRHLYYKTVTEYNEDNFGTGSGYTVYNYNDENIPDVGFPAVIQPTINAGELSGSNTFNASNASLQSSANVVQADAYIDGTNLCAKVLKESVPSTFSIVLPWRTYKIRNKPYRLAQTTTVIDNVSITKYYTYDAANRFTMRTSESITNSDGKVYKTEYSYIHDYTANYDIRDFFLNRNIINAPYRVVKKVNGVTIDDMDIIYAFYNASTGAYQSSTLAGGYGRPSQKYQSEYTFNTSGTPITNGRLSQFFINSYDAYGNIASITIDGWQPITYEWYSNGLMKKTTFQNHIKEYTYFPGTRLLNTFKEIDGQVQTYTYDKMSRLKSISEKGNNVVTNLSYHYKETSGDVYNWIKTQKTFTPTTNSSLTSLENKSIVDGLGRSIRDIKVKYSPQQKDIVIAKEYDNKGRLVKEYVPFESTFNNGSFVSIPSGTAYTLTAYEPSPLNRTSAVTPPSWYATSTVYSANAANEVLNLATNTYYPVNSLTKIITTNPDNKRVITFKDKVGRDLHSWNTDVSYSNHAKTYTLYDDKGRVSTVVPPGASLTTPDLLFSYTYDYSDNVLTKKVPGKAIEKILYDNRDLPTFYQDGIMAINNSWVQTEYDLYGRPVASGIIGMPSATPPSASTVYTPYTSLFSTSQYYTLLTDGVKLGKVKQQKSNILGTSLFIEKNINYDIYGRPSTINGTNYLYNDVNAETVSYTYDFAGNVMTENRVHKQSSVATLNQTINKRNTFDHSGRAIDHFIALNGGAEQKISNLAYTNKDEIKEKNLGATLVSSVPSYLQSLDFTYNELGWLTKINQESLSASNSALPLTACANTIPAVQSAYTYGANPDPNDIFYLELKYDAAAFPNITGMPTNSQKSGNIAQIAYRVKGRDKQAFNYAYDFLNRMTASTHYTIASTNAATASNLYNENLGYDSRGNITSLNRQGFYTSGATCTYGSIDALAYTYTANTNKLTSITDAASVASKSRGFNPGLGGAGYTYDVNGNLKTDSYKGITNITYNHLNLPSKIEWGTTKSIELVYTAAGEKVAKTVKTGSTIDYIQHYIGGIEYNSIAATNRRIESIYHTEGRFFNTNASTTAPTYRTEYTIKDHLGNARVSFTDIDNNGKIDVTTSASTNEIIQENHFYAFGLNHEGPWLMNSAAKDNAYQYNGKELNADHGLNLSDYGARWYDAAIGRWSSVDPLAEKFAPVSGYVYAINNPVKFLDPDGKDVWEDVEKLKAEVDARNAKEKQNESHENIASDNASAINGDAIGNNNGEDSRGTLQSDQQSTEESADVGDDGCPPICDKFDRRQQALEDMTPEERKMANAMTMEAISYVIPLEVVMIKVVQWLRYLRWARNGTKVASKAAKGGLKPLGLGSTAKAGVSRVNPVNLIEELAMKEIMSNPSMGRVMDGLKKGMTDKRWHKDNGWVKMSWNNGGVEIHYVGQWQNGVLKAVDDFKIIGQ